MSERIRTKSSINTYLATNGFTEFRVEFRTVCTGLKGQRRERSRTGRKGSGRDGQQKRENGLMDGSHCVLLLYSICAVALMPFELSETRGLLSWYGAMAADRPINKSSHFVSNVRVFCNASDRY